MPRSRGSTTSSSSASTSSSCCRSTASTATHNWGYDGVAWYAVHEGYGGPAALPALRRRVPRAGLAVIQDVVYNHLGPERQLPAASSARTSTTARATRGATRSTSTSLDGAPLHRSTTRDVAAGLPRRRPAPRCRARPRRRRRRRTSCRSSAEETDALSAHLGRPLTLIAESDMNDPRLILPREAGGYGLDRAVERRLPPRHPRRRHGRDRRLLRRLRARRMRCRRPRRRGSSTTGRTRRSASAPTASPSRPRCRRGAS